MDSSNPLSSSSSQQNTSTETVELLSDSSEHESQSSLQSNASKNTTADGIYVTNLTGTLTLKEYYIARKYYCSLHHSACKECSSML